MARTRRRPSAGAWAGPRSPRAAACFVCGGYVPRYSPVKYRPGTTPADYASADVRHPRCYPRAGKSKSQAHPVTTFTAGTSQALTTCCGCNRSIEPGDRVAVTADARPFHRGCI
jgi:hypothetical protein